MNCSCKDPFYKPWYTGKFKGIDEIVNYWKTNYNDLRNKSELFKNSFYKTSLPGEVIEAIAANLVILKSPTVLRQPDGKLWSWEGCGDNSGCCAGSCTHVWNYAQAIPHLFPKLERTLRETEFFHSQDKEGHQTFRSALPIRAVATTFYAAADGQLGGIMKMYREWRISGWQGLNAPDPVAASSGAWNIDYSDEARELLQKEGPKYQYGTGCLSDGVLGAWIAEVRGLDCGIDTEKVVSHLKSVYRYNFKSDLSNHSNPQRPSYALGKEGGLLLCSWRKVTCFHFPSFTVMKSGLE